MLFVIDRSKFEKRASVSKVNGFFVEVTNIRTNSHKMNKLRNVYTIGREARSIHHEMRSLLVQKLCYLL